MVLSVAAVIATATLEAVADVSQIMMVLPVIVVGFVASWVLTSRVTAEVSTQPRRVGSQPGHRTTVLPARQRVA